MTKKSQEKPQESPALISNELFKSRVVTFFGEMKPAVSKSLAEQLLALAAVSDDPIKLYINSPGGHVESGDTIHDLIRFLRPTVICIGTGYVASIATHIFLAAELQNRICLPNTRFLLHQPSGGMGGQATDVSIQAQEIIRTKARINHIIAERTGQPLKKVQEDTERDFWLSGEEAIAYGLCGRIVHTVAEIEN
jgi:ATP-dependent Clp protease, protease subunit